MALSVCQTMAVSRLLKPGMKVASMGYPDLIAPLDTFGDTLKPVITYRKDSAIICKRHGIPERSIPDAESFFTLNDCTLDVYDIVNERGCEILCDLNKPINNPERYDMVLDVGTVEHCFNIAQAVMNMAGMVKKGGFIIHENPFNWGNHGFFNLNPTWYHDFYETNGFRILELRLTNREGESVEAEPFKRFHFVKSEVNIFALAQRTEIKEFSYPMQSKYAGPTPGLRAEVIVDGE